MSVTLSVSVWAAVCTVVLLGLSASQGIEDIRLVNNASLGSHVGRVEVLYNGTWGVICNNNWNYQDARVVCRMLGFRALLCQLTNPLFSEYNSSTPVWMDNLRCSGRERRLDLCPYDGFGINTCTEIVGELMCASPYVVGSPTQLKQLKANSISVTIQWTIPSIPSGVSRLRFQIRDQASDGRAFNFYTYDNSYDGTMTVYEAVIGRLSINSSYSVTVRTDIRYPYCSNWLWGNYSDPFVISTNDTIAPPMVPTRLVPPQPGADIMGRVEVMYNSTWGTVCDDLFSVDDASVVCRSLNFSRALCSVPRGRMGHGSGPIWMDNVQCSLDDYYLEECDFGGWGNHNCQHDDDVGVICLPDVTSEYRRAVSGVTVSQVTATTITLAWNSYRFPRGVSVGRYRVWYGWMGSRATTSVISPENRVTLERLQFNATYTMLVRAEYRYQYCPQYIFANYSSSVTAITFEQAPTGPPTSFHVLVLNSTAIEIQWEHPLDKFRNGIVRGFKLFVRQQGTMTERTIVYSGSSNTEYILSGLTPNTAYSCSLLAYTISDGPRTISLTVVTAMAGSAPLIVRFGINGDGYDRAVQWLNQTDVRIHCGTGSSNVSVKWMYSNGTEIGTQDRNMRQGYYDSNGTAVLQIASARRLSYCDAGVYTCVANDSQGLVQTRKFSLLISDTPPEPSIPYAREVGSTWITLGWDDLNCNGGHLITGFNIRYRKETQEYHVIDYFYVYNVNASLYEYTLQNLEPSTAYSISIQALSAEYQSSSYSVESVIETLLPAPGPPRDVTARLVSSLKSIVEVKWREPAIPNGIITHYTVYGSVLSSQDGARGPISLVIPDRRMFMKRYDGHIGAANVTVPSAAMEYVFEVTAWNNVNGIETEGEYSVRTRDATVYVPAPGLPIPQNVEATNVTNSSVVLRWNYPSDSSDAILYFRVVYFATVEWVSPNGYLVMFDVQERLRTTEASITVTQLVPATDYEFRIAVFTVSGSSADVSVSVRTSEPNGEKLAYFQLMISPIGSCVDWLIDAPNKVRAIKLSLIQHMSLHLCRECGLTNNTVSNGELSCRGGLTNAVIYRARILGTDSYSASGLVTLLKIWTQSAKASVMVGAVRLHINSLCDTYLDNPTAPDCAVSIPTTSPSSPTTSPSSPTTSPSSPTTSPSSPATIVGSKVNANFTNGLQIGGIIIGVIILLLLLVFIILLVILVVRVCNTSSFGMKKLKNEPQVFYHKEEENPVTLSDVSSKDIPEN